MASDRRIWVLIPAAGESQRFRQEGFTRHKPYLTVTDRTGVRDTMLNHVVTTLGAHPHVMVALPNGGGSHPFHRSVLSLNVMSTASHMDTVRQMLQCLHSNDSVLIVDCDTIIGEMSKLIFDLHQDFIDDEVLLCVANWNKTTMSMARIDRKLGTFYEPGAGATGDEIHGIVSARYFSNVGKLRWCAEQSDQFSHILSNYGAKPRLWWTEDWQDWGTPERLRGNNAIAERS